ncbi:MAG: DUF1573 domain-containing protein [Zavarzinella sp.]
MTPSGLVCDKAHVDLGKVRGTSTVVHSFEVKNASQESCSITEIAGSCNCFRKSIASKTLGAGDSTTIQLGINALAQPEGKHLWKFVVRTVTAGGATQELILSLRAEIVKEVRVEPISLALSGSRPLTGTLSVKDSRMKGLQVTRASTSILGVEAKLVTGKPDQQVEIVVGEQCPPGTYTGEVSIFTNDSDYAEMLIPLRVTVTAPNAGVSVYPKELDLLLEPDQVRADAVFRLKSPNNEKIIIKSIASDHPGVTCSWKPGPGTMATGLISVDTTKSALKEGKIIVELAEPSQQKVVIPVLWSGEK